MRHPLPVVALYAVLVLAAYSFMLRAPFRSMDDATTIVENQDIRGFQNLPKVFTGSFFGDRSYYRPLVTASYMAEYAFFKLDAFWFNLDNVILHILNSLCVFALIRRLFNCRNTAFWAALLFAVHPVQWEAVSNISGRAILLSALFVFSSMILFLDFYKSRQRIFLVGSLVSFILAMFSKESSAVLPVVLTLYIFFNREEKSANPRPWFSLAPFFLLVAGFLSLRQQLGITQLFAWGSGDALTLGFLSFARGCITFLRLFVFPVDLYFDRSRAVFLNFSQPELILTVIFWISVLWMIWHNRHAAGGTILFLIAWFLIDFAPVSQIVTSLGVQPGYISLAEHFLYVPSVAMLTLLVVGVRHLWQMNKDKKWCSPPVAGMAVAGVIIFFYLTTIQQAVYAGNELSMLKRSIAMQPNNSRVQYSLGMNYVRRGLFQPAEHHFRTATAVDPWNIRARIALGKVLCDQGRFEEGIAVYRSVTNPGPFAEILQENLKLSLKILDSQKRPH